jgi:hypothetical protein
LAELMPATILANGRLALHGRRPVMTDKKKGDFDQWQRKDEGGDKKQRADRNENSRTGNQNSGSGGRP